jgi:hypothetical protein
MLRMALRLPRERLVAYMEVRGRRRTRYRTVVVANRCRSPVQPGDGDFSFTWGLVLPEVARFTRACSYDKAFEAWSNPGPLPRTHKQDAYELRLLLTRGGVKGPYVLVGASCRRTTSSNL